MSTITLSATFTVYVDWTEDTTTLVGPNNVSLKFDASKVEGAWSGLRKANQAADDLMGALQARRPGYTRPMAREDIALFCDACILAGVPHETTEAFFALFNAPVTPPAPPAVQTWQARVVHDADTITLTSIRKDGTEGASKTFSVLAIEGGWEHLKEQHSVIHAWLNRMTRGKPQVYTAQITQDDVNTFKGACALAEQHKDVRAFKAQQEAQITTEAKITTEQEAQIVAQITGKEETFAQMADRIAALIRQRDDKTVFWRLNYYIPAIVSTSTDSGGYGKFGNLSLRCDRAGFGRGDGSNRYVHEKQLKAAEALRDEILAWNEQDFVKANRKLRTKAWLDDIGPLSREITRQRIHSELCEWIGDLHAALLEKMDSAAKKIDELHAQCEADEKAGLEGMTQRKLAAAQKSRNDKATSALSAARAGMKNAVLCAQAFDETEDVRPLFAGLTAAIEAYTAALIGWRKEVK